jgi:hypothetical protein
VKWVPNGPSQQLGRKRAGREKNGLRLDLWRSKRAVVEVLNAVYEEDFLGFSYGFRPGRSQHDALDALAAGIAHRKVNWILDADIRSFLDAAS